MPLQGKEEIKDAYFIGAIIGDGNYSSDRGIRFYNEDDEVWEYIKSIGKEYSIFKSYITKNNKLYREGRIIGGTYRDWETDRKSTRLNSSHSAKSRMPSSA